MTRPGVVSASAEALKDSVGHYAFVSTISVYPPAETPHKEDSEVLEATEGMDLTAFTAETYGALKILCEREVQRVYGEKSVIVRPGLVVGPGDHTDRFSYWPVRMLVGGDVLVPDNADMEWQWIDARDLGEFTVSLVERGISGAFNGVGPAQKTTMGEVLAETQRIANPDARLVMVEEQFLKDQGVEQWSDLPFVLWSSEGKNPMIADISKSLAHGMTLRPIAETVSDLVAWRKTLPDPQALVTGLSAEKQAELLEAWKTRTG